MDAPRTEFGTLAQQAKNWLGLKGDSQGSSGGCSHGMQTRKKEMTLDQLINVTAQPQEL